VQTTSTAGGYDFENMEERKWHDILQAAPGWAGWNG